MNQTTPKQQGINYAKLRKSKYKEDTIPKSISNNIKFDISNTFTSSQLKHRSCSQHTINYGNNAQQQQIQLFEQYFNSSKIQDSFINFVTKQIHYHQNTQQPNVNIFKNCSKKWEEEKRQILYEINQQKEDNCLLQAQIYELKKTRNQLSKQCDMLQEKIVKERLNKQKHFIYHHEFQELSNRLQLPSQETISSLTDERFISNETSLNSSLSNEDDGYDYQPYEMYKSKKHRYQMQKKLL